MSARSKLWRGKRCRWLLIALCSALLSLLTRNAAAITVVATANSGVAATNAATNYQQNRKYEDAAAAVVTATMNAAALPMAKTTNDYAQQLPRYYAAPIYRNYFESVNTGNGDKTDAATVILRDHMAQWHLPAAGGHATAATTDESAMTTAGFVPTTMTAAGQHYVASTSADAATAVGHAHAGVDFSTSGARFGGNAARSVSGTDAGAAYTYEYAMPKGKIDYELNEANYQSAGNGDNKDNGSGGGNGAEQVAVNVAEGGAHMSAADAYDMYKYDVNEYARQMQRALSAASVGGKEAHYAAAAVDESGNQGVSGDGGASAYFENQLPSYENYFMPTYQLGQFSNYHSPQAEQEQELKRQQRQNEQPKKADGALQEEQRTQLRPLTLFDSADDNNAMLQQFKKSANIENYANDRQKLHYFAKQPQLEQQQQPQQQQQQRQQQSQQQYEEQQHLQAHYQQQQLQKQLNQQQQKLLQQQQLPQQPQQLPLSHQLRKFPELMHFSLHHHLPRQRQRLATTLSKVTRPHSPLALSTRRRRRQQRRDATSRQVIGNAGTQSSLPTQAPLHADADSGGKSNSNSNNNANGDTLTLQSRLGNDKRSISDNFVDITGEPTQFSYARVYPAHVSQLLDDSANEIDDTPNNIDDNDAHNSQNSDDNDNENEDETNRRDHQHAHYLAAISHPQVKAYRQLHSPALVQQYVLPPITTSERHTPASTAALAGIPLARHVEVTKHIPAVDYERVHVPYNHSVPIRIPQPIITAVPRPYAIRVPVTKTIAVPKVQEVRIPIEKVKPYPVERPVPFVVERRVPYMVEKQVAKPVYYPYPVKVPIVKTIVHKIPRRTHSYTTYQPHASSYPISLGQYHLQQQPHLESHAPPTVHYAHPEHLG
uniref:Uncharacterized protein n=1 Tax=Zeugodacus cucurbitae TaxID=28588 RepID=A0A0A1XDL7_ZEUCU